MRRVRPPDLAFLVACTVVIIVPGPTVTLIIANSLRYGRRAGMLNVAGPSSAWDHRRRRAHGPRLADRGDGRVVRLASPRRRRLPDLAGRRLLTAPGGMEAAAAARKPRSGFFVQGLAVALSNPKTLLFFGAFFPQFMDAGRDFAAQALIMGVTAMAVAAVSDSAYAVLASRAGVALSRRRVRLMTRLSGGALIGGGLWLALSRAK